MIHFENILIQVKGTLDLEQYKVDFYSRIYGMLQKNHENDAVGFTFLDILSK